MAETYATETPSDSAGPDPAESDKDSGTKVAQLQAELARAGDQYMRALADLDNYRKRFDRELMRLRDQDREAILRDLLPIVDNLERALSTAQGSTEPLYAGVEAVHRQLMSHLKRYGVEPNDDIGRSFDPLWHEVLATTPADKDEGTIVDIAERGYRRGDTPLRPARVVVAKGDNAS